LFILKPLRDRTGTARRAVTIFVSAADSQQKPVTPRTCDTLLMNSVVVAFGGLPRVRVIECDNRQPDDAAPFADAEAKRGL
jgi:hypothetical protein